MTVVYCLYRDYTALERIFDSLETANAYLEKMGCEHGVSEWRLGRTVYCVKPRVLVTMEEI